MSCWVSASPFLHQIVAGLRNSCEDQALPFLGKKKKVQMAEAVNEYLLRMQHTTGFSVRNVLPTPWVVYFVDEF